MRRNINHFLATVYKKSTLFIVLLVMVCTMSFAHLASALDVDRPIGFLGSLSEMTPRIGSLAIGSSSLPTWLSLATGQRSCINKNTIGRGQGWGMESCLDVAGDSVFDAIIVSQPAYILGSMFIDIAISSSSDPAGLIVGSDHGTNNGVMVTGLGRFGGTNSLVRDFTTHRYLCASGTGELFACTQGPVEDTYNWVINNCVVRCQDPFGNEASSTGLCTDPEPDIPESCVPSDPIAEYRFDACEYAPRSGYDLTIYDSIGTNHALAPGSLGTVDSQHGRAVNFQWHDPETDENGLGLNDPDEYGVLFPDSTDLVGTFSYSGWFRAGEAHEVDTTYNPSEKQCRNVNDYSEYVYCNQPNADSWDDPDRDGSYNQRWAVNPKNKHDQGYVGHAGTGLSFGTNGVSLYEHTDGMFGARIVYTENFDSDWVHVVVVYDNNQPTLYVNGEFVGTGPVNVSKYGSTTNLEFDYPVHGPEQIGHSKENIFRGQIDEFKIYDHALDSGEVLTLFNFESNNSRASSCPSTDYRWEWSGWICNTYNNYNKFYRNAECKFGDRPYAAGDEVCELYVGPKPDSEEGGNCNLSSFVWKTSVSSSCVPNEYGGYYPQDVTCWEQKQQGGEWQVSDSWCNSATRPASWVQGNCPTTADSYVWNALGDWGECSFNTQYQTVRCDNASTGVSNVGDQNCNPNTKPSNSRYQDCTVTTYSWHTGDWGSCNGGVRVRDVHCDDSNGVHNVGDGNCSGAKPTTTTTEGCGSGGGGSSQCRGSYTITTPGSCSGSFTTTGQQCNGGTYTYTVPTGTYADVSVAEQQCGAQGYGISPCQSGYNCNDGSSICIDGQRQGYCSNLQGSTTCNANGCSWGDAPGACTGGTFTYTRSTGTYADVSVAEQQCGAQGYGISPCQSGYNCNDGSTQCSDVTYSGNCSDISSQSACGGSDWGGSGICSWNTGTTTQSCSGNGQSQCTGSCSWNTGGSTTVSCGNITTQSGCESKGCLWG